MSHDTDTPSDEHGEADESASSPFEPPMPLTPETFRHATGLGPDDEIGDLNDREKAAGVWALVSQSDEFHIRVHDETDALWGYNTERGVWDRNGERVLRFAARQAVGPVNYGEYLLRELKAQARADPDVLITQDALGVDPGTVAVGNGLLDLEAAADALTADPADPDTAEDAIRDLQPTDYALARLPVDYDPTAPWDEWQALAREWPEDGMEKALQEYVGYSLHVNAFPIHRAMLLVGNGANGKGTFLYVVTNLLGTRNTTNIELQRMAKKPNALADFHGSLANIDNDLNSSTLGKGLGTFKKITGGDTVRARHLYEAGFEFLPTGKHLYAANTVPEVNVPEDDEAFWRRWLIIEFDKHYPDTDEDTDESLRDQFTEPDALSGVLNWAILGYARALKHGHFTNEPPHVHDRRDRWLRWGESIDRFISECVSRDEDAPKHTTGDAHRRYAAWCRENGEKPASQRQLTSKLKTENVGYAESIRVREHVTNGYYHLGLSDDVPALETTPDRQPDPTTGDADDSDDTRGSALSDY